MAKMWMAMTGKFSNKSYRKYTLKAFSLLIFILITCLIFSCGKKTPVSKVFFVSSHVTTTLELSGGMIIYGINSEEDEQFALPAISLSELKTKEIELAVGSWIFYAFGWETESDAQGNYEGSMYCARSSQTIQADTTDIDLSMSRDCNLNGIAEGTSLFNDELSYELLTLSFNSCSQFSESDDPACTNPGKGKSFQVMLYGYEVSSADEKTINLYNGNLSACYPFSDGIFNSDIKIPFGDLTTKLFAGVINVFDDETCEGEKTNSIYLLDGFHHGPNDETEADANINGESAIYDIFIASGKNSQTITAPTAIVLTSDPASTIGNDDTPELTISGVTSGHEITLYSDSSCSSTYKSATAQANSLDITMNELTEGTHNLYTQAEDEWGNVSSCSDLLMTYTLDTNSPSIPSNLSLASGNGQMALTWSGATDDITSSSDLQYQVYYSTSDNINTWSDRGNGTSAGDWATDITSKTISNLSSGTSYYINVFVRDEAGNIESYETSSNATIPNGMSLWLDAQDTNSLILDGSLVNQWDDGSGNSYHAAYPANQTSVRPTLSTSSLNGYDSVKFEDSLLEIQTLHIGGSAAPNLTMFAVLQHCGGYSAILVGKQNGFTKRKWDANSHDDDVNTANILAASYSYCDSTPNCSQQDYWTNGTPEGSSNATYTEHGAGVGIGATLYSWHGYVGAYYSCLYLGELIIYQDALTTSEREAIELYLSNKWDVSLSDE